MPSLGKDLALIRKHLGKTIEDIHGATKIPLTTLKSIESGSIFKSQEEIETYVRSFVRTYGRVLKLDDQVVVKALNQQDAGNYQGLLLNQFPELSTDAQVAKPDPGNTQDEKEPEQPKSTPQSSSEVSSRTTRTTQPPGVRNINWADMGKKFSSTNKSNPTLAITVVIICILLLGIGYFLIQADLFSSEDPPVMESTPNPSQNENLSDNNLQLEITADPRANETEQTELDSVLILTVYAAYDKLEPIRIWSDLKPQIDPYWLNQGIAYNFNFADTIRVRGQYSRMLLFLNGHLIENPRQLYFNPSEDAIELTRSLFQDNSKWAVPSQLEIPDGVAPPDTLTERPRF